MADTSDAKTKTLELLKDWSIGLVGIDTGALALLGSLSTWEAPLARALAILASALFFISLAASSFLVGAIPVIAERLHLPQEHQDSGAVKVRGKRTVYQCTFGLVRLQDYALIQHAAFLAAAALITAAFVVKTYCVRPAESQKPDSTLQEMLHRQLSAPNG
jgi:cobalamin synthase